MNESTPQPEIPQCKPYVIEEEPGIKFWCHCGKSQKQPYCDGSHKGCGIAPVKVEIEHRKTVAWCGCKHSNNKPFCDGSHARLAQQTGG